MRARYIKLGALSLWGLVFLGLLGCASSSADIDDEENLAIEDVNDSLEFSQGNNFSQSNNQFNNDLANFNNSFNQENYSSNEMENFQSNDFSQNNLAENYGQYNNTSNQLASNNSEFINNNFQTDALNEKALSNNQFQNLEGKNATYNYNPGLNAANGYTEYSQENIPVIENQNQNYINTETPTGSTGIVAQNGPEYIGPREEVIASSNYSPSELPNRLTWIGYDYLPLEKKVTLQLKFRRKIVPTWETIRDAFNQLEYQLKVPGATAAAIFRRDLDARQFYSPLSYVKVIDYGNGLIFKLTLRDEVEPTVVGDETGNLNIQFAIPGKYMRQNEVQPQGALASAEIIDDPKVLSAEFGEDDGSNISPREEIIEESPQVLNTQAVDSDDIGISPDEAIYDSEIQEAPTSIEGDFNGTNEEFLNGSPNATPGSELPSTELPGTEPPSNDLPMQGEPEASLNDNTSVMMAASIVDNPVEIVSSTVFFAATVAQDFIENEQIGDTGSGFDEINDFSADDPFGYDDTSEMQNVGQNSGGPNQYSTLSNFGGANVNSNEPQPDANIDLNSNLIESQDASNMAGGNIKGKALTLSFRGAPLNEVIRAIMGETGINFTMPSEIGKIPIFIEFKQVFWVDALKAILQTYNLGFVDIAPNLVRIDQLERLNAEKTMLEEIRKSTVRLTDTKILVVRLSYARAETLAPRVKEILRADTEVDPRVNISADNRTNSLYIEAIPIVLAKVKAIVEKLDLQTPQVKIESRIVEVIKTTGEFLGINWSQPFNYNAGRGLGFGSVVFPNSLTSSYSVDTGATTPRVGNINLLVGSINNTTELDLRLAFEESKGTTEILESSSITVQDSTEAKIKAGTTDYFRSNAIMDGNGMVTIEYFLTLAVTPNITSDGNVLMNLKVSSTNPRASQAARAEAGSTNRDVETTLIRGSGETAAIGGLYTTNKVEKVSGIPFLSSIPIIGRLFKSVESSESRRELVVLITPTIVNYSGQGAMVKTSELAGSSGANDVLGRMEQGPASEQYNNFNTNNQGNNMLSEQGQSENYQENDSNQFASQGQNNGSFNQGQNNGINNQGQNDQFAGELQQNNGQFSNFNNEGGQQNNGALVNNQGQSSNFNFGNNWQQNNSVNNFQSSGNSQGQINDDYAPLEDDEFGNEEF